MKKKKVTILIILLFFGSVFIYIHYIDKRIEKEGVLLNAMTTVWVGRVNMGMHLQYEFFYNGKKIIGERGFKNIRGNRDFQKKAFPVMYDPKFGTSQLLVEPIDFKEFNLPYPDSLTWVLQYLK